MIRANFFESPTIRKLDVKIKLLLIGLVSMADDRGNGLIDTILIKAFIFNNDDEIAEQNILDMLEKLYLLKRIRCYSVDDEKYYHVIGWRDKGSPVFQKLDKPRPNSEIPIYHNPEYLSDQYLGKNDEHIHIDNQEYLYIDENQ